MWSLSRSLTLFASSVGLCLLVGCHDSKTSFATFTTQKIYGSGVITEQTRAVDGTTRVSFRALGTLSVEQVAGAIHVVELVSASEPLDGSVRTDRHASSQPVQETLRIRIEDNLLPYLTIDVAGTQLSIGIQAGVDLEPTLPIEFFLTVASLEEVAFGGVGGVDVGPLTVDTFIVTSTGVGQIELESLTATQLEVTQSSVSSVRATGNVDRQVVRMSGIGSYEARDLQSREADVLVSGIGDATVRVSDLLIATIRSSGSIFYIGDPTVDADITGSGTVEQIGR